ncbi:TPA: hypothetical protein N0F65_009549 [Lagenidium giganteum]|uniref:Uncharacterized protein n=1 Tax=Lagenidium giganteum TaxID=4803 RepID=A0AAV2YVD1_9STRA|nr:TPA: hypothetical protein N0F65_009549 [Lagenidium giganteum]
MKRSDEWDRAIQFYWRRFFGSVTTLLLLSTDVIRSGLGIRSLSNLRGEPNSFEMFGPWMYTVSNLTRNDTEVAAVWSFKFDTIPIVWRSFATTLPDRRQHRTVCEGRPSERLI